MGIADSTCPGQLCCPYSRSSCVRTQARRPADIHPQPLLTAIPAWLKMGRQVVGDTVGLVLDPLHWRSRLVGTQLTQIHPSSCSQPDSSYGVYPPSPAQATNGMPGSPSDFSHHDPPAILEPANEGKREKKTVHFIEPEQDKKHILGSDSDKSPCERAKLELYEAVCPADDIPRVIVVDYDCEDNRWRVDKSAIFPDREDPIVMICTKSVLQAMKGDTNTVSDSVNKSRFQLNRLPNYGVFKLRDGDLAMLNASSHDLFHVTNLEKFLLHAHKDPQHAIAASGGQYMRHWLIPLQQLMTILSKPDTRQVCKAAFWELARRGVAEKVTLQLWDAGDPQPEESADVENLEWTIWVKEYKNVIPDALRQDLVRALEFFHASVIPGSSWPAVLHPNLFIMSHQGITSAVATKPSMVDGMRALEVEPWSRSRYVDPISPRELGKAVPTCASTSSKPCFAQNNDVVEWSFSPSVEETKPLRQPQHVVHAPSPHPYSRPMTPPLPGSLLDDFSSWDPQKLRQSIPRTPVCPNPSDPSSPNQPLAPVQHLGMTHEPHRNGSPGSMSLTSKNSALSDVSASSYDWDGADLPSEGHALHSHEQSLATVDYGKVTGGLIEPTGIVSNTSHGMRESTNRASARAKQALHKPKPPPSSHEHQRSQASDPDLAESQARAMKMLKISTRTWQAAAAKYGMTNDNAAPPALHPDAFDGVDAAQPGQMEFSYQLDEALHAEQRLTRSATMSKTDLEKCSEKWTREQEKIRHDRQIKRELRKMLALEWGHLRWGSEAQRLDEELTEATDAAKDVLHSSPETRRLIKKSDFLSDEHGPRPFENVSVPVKLSEKMCLLDTSHKAVKAQGPHRSRQLEEPNETSAHLKLMLNAAEGRERAANERERQKDKILEGMEEELRELKILLRFKTKDGQVLAGASCGIDCPQALFEGKSYWNEASPDASRSELAKVAGAGEGNVSASYKDVFLASNDNDDATHPSPPKESDVDANSACAPGSHPIKDVLAPTEQESGSEDSDFTKHNGTCADSDRFTYSSTLKVSPGIKLISSLPAASPAEVERDHRVAWDARLRSMSPTTNGRSSPQTVTQPEVQPNSVHTDSKGLKSAVLCAGPPSVDSGEEIDVASSHDSAKRVQFTHSTNSAPADEDLPNCALAASPEALHDSDLPNSEGALVASTEDHDIGDFPNGNGLVVAALEEPTSGGSQSPSSRGKKKYTTAKKWTHVKRNGKAK